MLSKQIMKDEMLCTSREEHIALFGMPWILMMIVMRMMISNIVFDWR